MEATIAYVIGYLAIFAFGYWGCIDVIKRWLKISDVEFARAEQHFVKYGLFALCFAWVPIIGDPLTVIAGILRIRLFWFLILVTAGKLMSYDVVSF